MEKVKLTQEQADAIKKLKAEASNKEIIYMNTSPFGGIYLDKDKQTIFEMDLDELIRALYVGYEVELEIKVGDWVFIDYGEAGTEIGFIKGWINEPHSFYIDKCHFGANVNEARHATLEEIAEEKERRWWEKHGRDVWELKQGDIIGINIKTITINEVREDGYIAYFDGLGSDRIYSVDSLKSGGYKIICFAEDRKDA